MCVFGPRHRSPSVQYAVLEDARAQARRRDCRNVRAADHRLGRIRGRAGAAQDAQPGAHCSAYHQRPDTAHRHLLLRRLRHGDDVADREGRTLPILHLLDQGPPGRDRLPRRQERAERRTTHIAELRKRASETDAKLKRLYDAIENGIADLSDPMLKDRVAELKAVRDQARVDAERAQDAIERVGPRASHRRPSKHSPGRPASACGPRAAVIVAITSARLLNALKWTGKKFASWARKANCCARSSPLQAQKRRVLACPVLYRSGAPEEIRTPDPQIRSLVLPPAVRGDGESPCRRTTLGRALPELREFSHRSQRVLCPAPSL